MGGSGSLPRSSASSSKEASKRSIRWIASGTVVGIALAGVAVLGGGLSPSSAQGAMSMGGYGMSPGPRYYRARPPAMGVYRYRPAPRARYYRSPSRAGSCGQFRYWDTAKGACLAARTSPPDLK